jgi:hypothetical protein
MSSALEQARNFLEPLVDQPITQRLLTEASSLRDRTIRMQEATLGALNLPTAADLVKLERRLRSLTEAVAGLDEHLDRVEGRLRRSETAGAGPTLAELSAAVESLREELARKD